MDECAASFLSLYIRPPFSQPLRWYHKARGLHQGTEPAGTYLASDHSSVSNQKVSSLLPFSFAGDGDPLVPTKLCGRWFLDPTLLPPLIGLIEDD